MKKMGIKLSARLLVFTFILVAVTINGFAQDFYFYGDNFAQAVYLIENDDCYFDLYDKDFNLSYFSDIYLEFRNPERYSFLTDFHLAIDDASVKGTPVDFSVAQCYLMLPIQTAQMYIGKRYKDIGWSDIFNVVNRVSPRNYSSSDFRGHPPVNIEFGLILYPFTLNLLAWFEETKNIADTNWLFAISYLQSQISAELGMYYEEDDNWHLYSSLRFVAEKFSFYLDAIYDSEPVQKVPDTSAFGFIEQDSVYSWSTVFGINFAHNVHNLKLEYFHRNEGYDAGHVQEYFELADITGKMVLSEYRPFAFASDYIALDYEVISFISDDLSLRILSVLGTPGLFKKDSFEWEMVSAFSSITLTWTARQELLVSLMGNFNLGGKKGEFIAIAPAVSSIGIQTHLFF